jgi:hypothetical protein
MRITRTCSPRRGWAGRRCRQHPADPHPDQYAAAAGWHIRRRPLVITVHQGGLRAAARAGHRHVPGSRPHADHLASVLGILDDQRRQPGKHHAHKLSHIIHDRS